MPKNNKLKEKQRAERQERMKARWSNFTGHSFRFLVLALAGVLMFAGVMSLVDADPVVRYTIASVVVLFIIKELY
jgi:hypothetical protein